MSEEHKHGEMDIDQNEGSWAGFVKLVKYSSVVVAVSILILTIWLG